MRTEKSCIWTSEVVGVTGGGGMGGEMGGREWACGGGWGLGRWELLVLFSPLGHLHKEDVNN